MLPLITWSWPETPLSVLIVLLLALLARAIILRALRLGVDTSLNRTRARAANQATRAERLLARAAGLDHARHEARTRTIGSVTRSVTSMVIGVVATLTVLAILGVPLGPILTSAGIGGVALGFGAQSLVKDYLSGMLMVIEDQYGVGDLIDTGVATGVVEDVGLRVTRLRDAGGQVWYVRNGEITRVGNQSQGYSTGVVDVPVAYDEDAGAVIDLLNGEMDAVYADPQWEDTLLERPTVAGVNAVSGGAMTLRIFAKCVANQHWGVERDILERSVRALQQAGIRPPVLLPPAPPAQP